ncbi:MAG: mevalonate kinase [Thermoplasmata archaeon]|jgi:mevalonate kinase|nr:mevalonate kinase [Candidatus Sysuiplasma jiujiangense]
MPHTFSAPGKIILFGEHAVVFGEPAISTAINLRSNVTVADSDDTRLNGFPVTREAAPYAFHALRLTGNRGKSITVKSDIPSGGGLGSSAALSASLVASLLPGAERHEIAQTAYDVEFHAQGRASPIDTSTAVHGNAIFISSRTVPDEIWLVRGAAVQWHVGRLNIGKLSVVVGFTGRGAATGPMVEKVRNLYERFAMARDAVAEIGAVAMEARSALRDGDIVKIGDLMNRNQVLLSVIGVSTRELESLISAVLPYSYGAKLTGAGGGGSIIALTDKPSRASDAIAARGGIPYICVTGEEGLRREPVEGRRDS